jgi:hypothetical protein
MPPSTGSPSIGACGRRGTTGPTTVTFLDQGDGTTEVVTHQARVPAPFLSPEAQRGFLTSLDRCDAYVAGLVSEARRDSLD